MPDTIVHGYLNVVDGRGDVKKVLPENHGIDVAINKKSNVYLNSKNIDNEQKLADVVGADILSKASTFTFENGVFSLIDGNGNIIKSASFESSGPSIIVTTNASRLYGKTTTVKDATGTVVATGSIETNGRCILRLRSVGTYTVECEGYVGHKTAVIESLESGVVVKFNGQTLNITTLSLDDKEITCTGVSETFTKRFVNGKVSFVLGYSGSYTLNCDDHIKNITATGLDGETIDTTLDSGLLFGFHVSANEALQDAMISYPSDVVNKNYEPAYINASTGVFNYGSWKPILDSWLMPRPCMLKSDGTVAYYLDPNDYTKKEDGTDSDVSNENFDGNAMMEWGKDGKKIWYKVVPSNSSSTEATIYISDVKYDNDFVDYPFHGKDGTSKDHFYTAIYRSSNINGKFRSLSGKTAFSERYSSDQVHSAVYDKCTANGDNWDFTTLSERSLIVFLLTMIAKSTNISSKFGQQYGRSDTSLNACKSGELDKNGLFAYKTDSSSYGITKVFGIEEFIGTAIPILGLLYLSTNITASGSNKKYALYGKLTYGIEDGTSVNGYLLHTGQLVASDVEKYSFIKLYDAAFSYLRYRKTSHISLFGFMPGGETSTTQSSYYGDNDIIPLSQVENTIHTIITLRNTPSGQKSSIYGIGNYSDFVNVFLHYIP